MNYEKPSFFFYKVAQTVSWAASKIIFKRKYIRNEIKNIKGPFAVIANHEAALDFVNLICARKRPMSFVISKSFYNSLPVKGIMTKIGVIPKQQFQTSPTDLKKIKAVIDAGEGIVIYPAGLMSEDGLSTPIPEATYKFIKWLGADIYGAKVSGTYFAMPKWAKGLRPGKTTIDIYKMFSKEELEKADIETIKEKANKVILFDAYKDQEELRFRYKNNDNVEGLQNVLYICPHCKKEFTIGVKNKNTLFCSHCGYEEESDEYGFLHNKKGIGKEIRYVSDWSRFCYNTLKEQIENGEIKSLSSEAEFKMIDDKKDKFVSVGSGKITLSKEGFLIEGNISGKEISFTAPIKGIPSLPFSPGKHLEVQCGKDIYRCLLSDGKEVIKFINMVKIFHETKELNKV